MPNLTAATRMEHRESAFRRLGVSITYVERSDTTALGTGVVTESNTSTTIGSDTDADPGVLTSPMTDRDIADSGGKFMAGARVFKIRDADMPSAEKPPKKTSEITYDGNTFNIAESQLSGDGNIHMIQSNQVD